MCAPARLSCSCFGSLPQAGLQWAAALAAGRPHGGHLQSRTWRGLGQERTEDIGARAENVYGPSSDVRDTVMNMLNAKAADHLLTKLPSTCPVRPSPRSLARPLATGFACRCPFSRCYVPCFSASVTYAFCRSLPSPPRLVSTFSGRFFHPVCASPAYLPTSAVPQSARHWGREFWSPRRRLRVPLVAAGAGAGPGAAEW